MKHTWFCKGWYRLVIALVVCGAFTLFFAAQEQVKIYIIGDSTVMTYKTSEYPMAGWGQVFSLFFKQGTVAVDNRAIGGRSSRMFYTEDRWKTIVDLLKAGDYVFIQFGHNDRDFSKAERYTDTADYKKYLRLFIKETRAKSAIPVLVSPMNMNTWNGTTVREVFCENANDYRGSMLLVAKELTVPFIDLEKKSAALMQKVGQSYCANFHFLGLAVGEYPNYPDGKADGTHFQEMGALANARMVAEGIGELSSTTELQPLVQLLAPRNKLTVISNKPGASQISIDGTYPSGATITLKVIPNSGQTFEKWVDEKGVSVATTARHTFTMGDAAVSFTAVFKGGSTSVLDEGTRGALDKSLSPIITCIAAGSLQITSKYPVEQVRLLTASGKVLRTVSLRSRLYNVQLPTAGISPMSLVVEVMTAEGVFRDLVLLK